jgi:hypothetical protein
MRPGNEVVDLAVTADTAAAVDAISPSISPDVMPNDAASCWSAWSS